MAVLDGGKKEIIMRRGNRGNAMSNGIVKVLRGVLVVNLIKHGVFFGSAFNGISSSSVGGIEKSAF